MLEVAAVDECACTRATLVIDGDTEEEAAAGGVRGIGRDVVTGCVGAGESMVVALLAGAAVAVGREPAGAVARGEVESLHESPHESPVPIGVVDVGTATGVSVDGAIVVVGNGEA